MARAKGIPSDYDTAPERFRANMHAVEKYGLVSDVHEAVAEQFIAEALAPILDLGCGEGRLTHPLRARNVVTVAFDYSSTMLAALSSPRVQGDANHLPFRTASFGGVAALYMLYHLDDPRRALAESHRVLSPNGIFAACAPSRHNDPELAEVLPPSDPQTFDAENGPELVAAFFAQVEVERWDAPLIHLPDRTALAHYLQGRGISEDAIERALAQITTPLRLTKRGALFYGRKPH